MLELKDVCKKYDYLTVVDKVNFTLRPGEVLGYLGPNGAGKTTTVKMLAGLVHPSSGEVFWNGDRIKENLTDYRRHVGYVPEVCDIFPHLSACEYLELVGRLRRIAENPLQQKIKGLLEEFGLRLEMHHPIATFSKGMRQKVLIAASLLHNPDILLLDEPLSGLDVSTMLVFRELVRELAEAGKAILYSSHVLEVVEKLCFRVLIINKGRIVAHDEVKNLRRLLSLPDLETVFRQLVVEEDPKVASRKIAEIVLS